MKKIMFSDVFGLTQAVLDGRKTMTRRIILQRMIDAYEDWLDEAMTIALPPGTRFMPITDYLLKHTPYCIGEVVAIAQSYKSVVEYLAKKGYDAAKWMDDNHITKNMAGWLNKMFVRAGLMIFKIRITNVKIERLQDISDEDCLREGVNMIKANKIGKALGFDEKYEIPGYFPVFDTPREAFATLIDKVSGKGTWLKNPYVFCYSFKLID